MQDFSAVSLWELCRSFYFSAAELFVVVLSLYFLLGQRNPNVLAVLLSSQRWGQLFAVVGAGLFMWGLYLAGARDLFAQLLQATGKKSNIS